MNALASSDENNFFILTELNFDDNLILIKLLDNIMNETNTEIRNFNTLLSVHKVLIKLNKIGSSNTNTNINTNTNLNNCNTTNTNPIYQQSSTSNSKLSPSPTTPSTTNNSNSNSTSDCLSILKIFLFLEIFKINFQSIDNITNMSMSSSKTSKPTKLSKEELNTATTNSNLSKKIISVDINEFCYKIYKLLLIEENNEINFKILDGFINVFLSEFLDPSTTSSSNTNSVTTPITFEKFIDLLEGNNLINTNTNPNIIRMSINKIIFENFLKHFKPLVYFYILKDKFKDIYEVMDYENKNKILTAELMVCFNKITRNLDDITGKNIFATSTKKFLQLIDTNQIFLSRREYYLIFFKSLSFII